jgi:hypothetical protein
LSEQVQINIVVDQFTLDDDPSQPIWPGEGAPPLGYRGATITAANQVFYLENYLPPGATLPNPAYITEFVVFDEAHGMNPYGANATGNVSFAVDPMSRYITRAGFPAVQLENPDTLKSLGVLRIGPGTNNMVWHRHDPPIAYRPGDAIIMGPEGRGMEPLNLFLGVKIAAENDLLPRPTSGINTVFFGTVDVASSINGIISHRNVIPPIVIGGTQVRIRLQSLSGISTTVQHASIGIRDGATSSTKATPVELAFGGNPGFSITGPVDIWSDWADLTMAPGDMLMVTLDRLASFNQWAYKQISHSANYSTNQASALSKDMGGTVAYQRARTHGVVQVQLR